MPTPTQVKSNIDSQVTNKTEAYSISNVEMGNTLKDIVDLTLPLQFATSADRLSYLTNPNAAPFQEANDSEDGGKYYINKAGTAWVQLSTGTAATTSGNFEIIIFNNLSVLTIAWDSTRQARFGVPSFVIETKDDDGKYRVKYGLEIYPDSISNTTSYQIDLGGISVSGRCTIK